MAQARWRRRNPDYAAGYRIQQRTAQCDPPAEPLRLAAPLTRLPWDLAKDEFGAQCADFIGILGALILHVVKDQIRPYLPHSRRLPLPLPVFTEKPSPPLPHTGPLTHCDAIGVSPTGHLRWEHLRAHDPRQQRHLLASLVEHGQQVPIIVVADPAGGSYVVIDGFLRIAALRQLGRHTVKATVWAMREAEDLLLERSLRNSHQETALEQGWLLAELERRFGYPRQPLLAAVEEAAHYGLYDLDRLERMILHRVAREYFLLKDTEPDHDD